MKTRAFLTTLFSFSALQLGGCQNAPVIPTPQKIEPFREEIPVRSVIIHPIETTPEPVRLPPQAEEPEPSSLASADLPRPAEAKNSPYEGPTDDPMGEPKGLEASLTADLPELPSIEPPKAQSFVPPPSPSPTRALFTQTAPPAVTALEKGIAQKIAQRSFAEAISDIERAIRIQPKNPELWHALALSRLRLGQNELAEDLAKKSNSFAKNEADLTRANWRLIAESRQKRGDGVGAQQARERTW